MSFKDFEKNPEGESPKRTISVNGGLGLLQMVSEPNTEQCASEDAGPRRRVDCEISHWLERGTKYSLQGRGNISLTHAF